MASSAHTDGEQMDDVEERQMRIEGSKAAHLDEVTQERDVLEYLSESDLADKLEENKYEKIRDVLGDLLSKDFPLGNLSKAEHIERKWDLRTLKDIVVTSFPSQDCLVVGEDRAAIYDDPSDDVTPLTREERLHIEAFFRNLEMRLTRAKGMKQQEMLRTSIAQTRVERDQDQRQGGGWLSKLRR